MPFNDPLWSPKMFTLTRTIAGLVSITPESAGSENRGLLQQTHPKVDQNKLNIA